MPTEIPNNSSLFTTTSPSTTTPLIDQVNHLKRDFKLIYDELNKTHGELACVRNDLLETQGQLSRANNLIRQLAVPTTPRYSTPSHPHKNGITISNNTTISQRRSDVTVVTKTIHPHHSFWQNPYNI